MVLMKKLTIVAKKDGGRGRQGRKILGKERKFLGKGQLFWVDNKERPGRENCVGVLRIVFMFPWCIFFFDKPWIFSLVMIVQIEYDDDESDKYDEEPENCLEMEEGVHLVTRTATAAAPSDLSGQTFLG